MTNPATKPNKKYKSEMTDKPVYQYHLYSCKKNIDYPTKSVFFSYIFFVIFSLLYFLLGSFVYYIFFFIFSLINYNPISSHHVSSSSISASDRSTADNPSYPDSM